MTTTAAKREDTQVFQVSIKATPQTRPKPIFVTSSINAISAASPTGIPASVSSAVSVTSRMP